MNDKRNSYQGQSAEDKEQVLKDNAKRARRTYQELSAADKERFLKDKAKTYQEQTAETKKSIDAQERLKRFKKATRFGPIFFCRCCERKLFEHQVIEVDMDQFRDIVNEKESGLFSQCIDSYSESSPTVKHDIRTSFGLDKTNYLCKGCKLSMQRGNMPKMCSNNGLKVDILPDPTLKLTELENNLIALNIIFQKFP